MGQTVRRPATPYRAATHALLAHLAAVGFDGAPRLLGADAATDTLSYIEGQAATAPLAGETLTDTALVSIAGLLRRYHQAAASFNPAGYRWPRAIPARFTSGLVSHNDIYPANFIFRAGRAVALIDFDLAGPAGSAGTWPPRPGTGARSGTSRTSPTPGRAGRCPGSGCCWTPTG